MKEQNKTTNNKERFVPVKYIRSDGTIEVYSDYLVSDQGRVGSLVDNHGNKRHAMKVMKPIANNKGYQRVGLYVRGKQRIRLIHRIVLSSFKSEMWSKNDNEVDHKDRNHANNILDNLQWTDRNGNCVNRDKCQLKRIMVTHLSDNCTEIFDNMRECSRAFGMCDNWCMNIIRKHDGFNAKHDILIQKI